MATQATLTAFFCRDKMEVITISNKPAHEILSYSDMVEMNEAKRLTRLYSKTEDASERVSALIANAAAELDNLPSRISLRDTQTVKAVTRQYLLACEQTGVLPSKMGLARAFGVSRQAIDNFISRNGEHDTTEFLRICFDTFAELLSNSALIGGVHPIMAIFVEKAVFGWKEQNVVEISTPNPLGESISQDELAARYGNDFNDFAESYLTDTLSED